jgi:hypothetical protein
LQLEAVFAAWTKIANSKGKHMSGLTCFGYRIPTKQLIGGLVFWLIIGIVLWSTRNLPMFDEGAPGPRFMPVVLMVLFSILNVFYWLEAATKVTVEEAVKSADEERSFRRPAAFFAIAVALAALWDTLGAVLTVFLCSVVELRFIEHFNWLRTIGTALAISAVALVLFQIVLGVALPGGVLEFLSYIRL